MILLCMKRIITVGHFYQIIYEKWVCDHLTQIETELFKQIERRKQILVIGFTCEDDSDMPLNSPREDISIYRQTVRRTKCA